MVEITILLIDIITAIVSLVVIILLLVLIEVFFIFIKVRLASCEMSAIWVFILLKKWVAFGFVCRSFSLIIQNYWLSYWSWYLLGITMFLELILSLTKWFCYCIALIDVCEKILVMSNRAITVCVFLFNKLSFFGYWSMCLLIHMRVFGNNRWLNCWLYCISRERSFVLLMWYCKWWVNMGILCCVVVGSVSTISSFTKCEGAWMSCCVKFPVPLKVSCVLMNVDFKQLLLVLSLKTVV